MRLAREIHLAIFLHPRVDVAVSRHNTSIHHTPINDLKQFMPAEIQSMWPPQLAGNFTPLTGPCCRVLWRKTNRSTAENIQPIIINQRISNVPWSVSGHSVVTPWDWADHWWPDELLAWMEQHLLSECNLSQLLVASPRFRVCVQHLSIVFSGLSLYAGSLDDIMTVWKLKYWNRLLTFACVPVR